METPKIGVQTKFQEWPTKFLKMELMERGNMLKQLLLVFMHMEHWEGLLVQKDQEIAALQTQIQAYIARASILQNRLLSTLDILDVTQSDHSKELDAMVQTNRRLKDKLHRHSVIVETAVLERDDMRDAVLKLVEKVELSNDYSMWPHSQIRLSSLTGGPIFQSPVVQASQSDMLFHASTMIETLCRERDLERKAHAQTRDLALARIVSLEAQLSRREAELETFISGATRTVSTIQHERPRDADQLIDDQLIDEQLTSEQVITALDDATVARNKTLEVEIKGLFQRLEEARLVASSSDLDGPPPPSVSGLQQHREIQQPLQPITITIPQNTPLQKIQSTSVLGVLGEPTACEPNDADQALVLEDPNYQAKEDFECRIKTLAAKIDAFVEERRSIAQTLRKEVDREDARFSAETRLESLENENHRLKLSERGLRAELDATRASAQARENELLDEIQSLRSNSQGVLEELNGIHSLLEPENGEMSMELATPLLPTRVTLEGNSLHVSSLPDSPPSIPLPPSPDNRFTSNSPILSQILLDRNRHHEHPDAAVNKVENLDKTLHPP